MLVNRKLEQISSCIPAILFISVVTNSGVSIILLRSLKTTIHALVIVLEMPEFFLLSFLLTSSTYSISHVTILTAKPFIVFMK